MPSSTLQEIAQTLDALHQQINALRSAEDKAQHEATLVERLKAILAAMQPLHADLVILSDGSGYIEVRDHNGEPFTSFLASFRKIDDICQIDPAKWPSFETLVRRWECARPTPRAGDYRDRSTWTTPGKLIATPWNGRKPGREWDV